MAAGDSDTSIVEQIEQLRQLSGSGDLLEGVFVAAEAQFLGGIEQLGADVQERQETPHGEGGWRDPAEARELIAAMPSDQQREQFERASETLLNDLVRVCRVYQEMAILGRDTATVTAALGDLLLSLHNPVVRESLLIPVAAPYEADVRQVFAELAATSWGFIEILRGEYGPHHRAYLERLAAQWGLSIDELESALVAQAGPGSEEQTD